jgi:hypothetical protein
MQTILYHATLIVSAIIFSWWACCATLSGRPQWFIELVGRILPAFLAIGLVLIASGVLK